MSLIPTPRRKKQQKGNLTSRREARYRKVRDNKHGDSRRAEEGMKRSSGRTAAGLDVVPMTMLKKNKKTTKTKKRTPHTKFQ